MIVFSSPEICCGVLAVSEGKQGKRCLSVCGDWALALCYSSGLVQALLTSVGLLDQSFLSIASFQSDSTLRPDSHCIC